MLQHVCSQPRLRPVAPSAVGTRAQLLGGGVHIASVVGARLRARETFPTEVASVGTLSRVTVPVRVQEVAQMEALSTHLALEGLLARVDALVPQQV